MQNNIIKQDLLTNSTDSFVIINPTKQQVAFFPKEESQMFTSKEAAFTGSRPFGSSNDPQNESENKDTLAFVERVKDPSNGATGGSIDYSDFYGSTGSDPLSGTEYKYDFDNISSSHTETNYIGSIKVDVPTIINETFATFNLYNLSTAFSSPFYQTADTTAKTSVLFNGVQTLRIPANVFNTILTDQTAIIANNNNPTVQNFGLYYIIVAPLYIRTTVGNVIARYTYDWLTMYSNGEMDFNTTLPGVLSITPNTQRRTVYECAKTDFQNLAWNFEGSGLQSGRLYGSVVEVWDAGETTLKQIKIMTENEFNFANPSAQTHFALYPDNVGYDAPGQKIITGDVLHIYPRETYFDQMIVQINYQNGALSIQNLIAFMMNDATRDITSGVYQVYDSNGFTIDTQGNFNGAVQTAYQIFSTGKIEARKTLKNPQGL
jgi:hypothetical protein